MLFRFRQHRLEPLPAMRLIGARKRSLYNHSSISASTDQRRQERQPWAFILCDALFHYAYATTEQEAARSGQMALAGRCSTL